MKQLSVRPRVGAECPRLKRELLCRKGLAHPRKRIKCIGADRRLMRGLRPGRGDDSGEETGETTHQHQCEAGAQHPLKQHVLPSSQKHLVLCGASACRGNERWLLAWRESAFPIATPAAPSARAATRPRASAVPPAARTILGAIPSTTRGTRQAC